MIKKTILCGALAFATWTPVITIAAIHANASATPQSVAKDSAITAKIKALYAKSSVVKALGISVTTNNQHVVLYGEVPTDTQYERAITLAQSVNGVKSIAVDNLNVTASKAPIKDTILTAKVKGVLLKERFFGKKNTIEYWPVKVETKDAVVYLSGKVTNEAQKFNLIKLAQSVDGVKSVDSSITLNK